MAATQSVDDAAAVASSQVTQSVIHNRLVMICREMGIAMMKTSYSTIFNEGLDFSCVIFNRDGEMIAQAEFCPAQLGAILFTVRWAIDEYGLENFEPDDVLIHNDPYRGGCHMPEHTIIKPVYYADELFGFVANIGHVAEIGGMAPGSFAATATEVYQEGLRLPLVKIMRRGEYVQDIWKIILANHRTPRHTWGDFHAMIGSLHIAERRLHELLDQYGVPVINEACTALMDHADRWMREEIRQIPNGEYSFEDCVEDDGATNNPTWIRVTMVVRDDEIIADFSESDPQAKGIVNATYGVTASATYNALFHVTDNEIPHNSGCYRPIKIIAPPGTVMNVQHPAPSVGGNTETHPRIVDIILGALSQVIPERVAAAEGGTSCNFLFGGTPPGDRSILRRVQLRGRRVGRKALQRRQQRRRRAQRQLPEYAGGSVRNALSLAHALLCTGAGLGWPGGVPRRVGRPAAAGGGRAGGDHGQRGVRAHAGQPVGAAGRGQGHELGHLGAEAGRRPLSHLFRGLRHSQRGQVCQLCGRDRATGF